MQERKRYQPGFTREDHFRRLINDALRPGMAILDVGGGHRPTIDPEDRPPDCTYVGLDISADEMHRAPDGSYDEMLARDLTKFDRALLDRFDLVVSLQTFEHIRPLDDAIDNLHKYLKPNGVLISQFSATFAYFSIANRILPRRAKLWYLARYHGDNEADIFPAYYHHCYYSALERMFRDWSEADIVPFYQGAGYLRAFHPVREVYLRIEDWLSKRDLHNLASNYVVRAMR